ncbi:hypothetical protein SOVF_163020 [Spinacia oleracea]|nr:hypothetical protein SOVF_163020 [Spinacia oleracea]
MVICEDETEALVKICVVDQDLEVELHEFVNPNKAVAYYRTQITGVSAQDLDGITCSLADIQFVLGYEVRKKDAPHNCVDDACAAMKLVLAKMKPGSDEAIPVAQDDVPDSETAKLLIHRIPKERKYVRSSLETSPLKFRLVRKLEVTSILLLLLSKVHGRH